MSQIILKAGVFLSSAMVILTLGCSDARTPKSLINPDTGKHDAGWESPDSHGAVAKAAAGSSSGFATCQECHADNFIGGISNITCLNTAGCHGASVGSPHSPKPWRGGTRTHTNTDQSNAPICALCHTNGANSSVQPSPFDPGAAPGCFNNTLCHSTPGHQAGWELPSAHGTAAKSAPTSTAGFSYCQTCHGNDFTGGAALQTCLNTTGCHGAGVNAPHAESWLPGDAYVHTTTDQGNAPVCALCHLNNRTPPAYATVPAGTSPDCFNNTLCHADVRAPHAVPYTDAALHGPSAKSDLTYCQACHSDQPAGGAGSNPRFNVAKGSLATGCEGASCHATNMAHPTPWRGFVANDTGHMTAGNMANACVLCHGANLDGVGGVGPACTSCHKLGSPLTMTNCTSCHGNPPNGSVYPNAVGKHSQHIALGSYIACAACHTGAGTGTTNHDNGNTTAFVAFLSSYNAKSGAASYNATTNACTNVSCHGGQTTPGWLSGTALDVNTQCTSCHASGTAQYNGYHSGQHSAHVVDAQIACYTCHDTTLLAVNHFTSLNTTALEGPASATIAASLNYTGVTCTPACHGTRTW